MPHGFNGIHLDVSLNCRNLNREDYNPTSDFGKQCTELCITHGHSDTCWMPLEGKSARLFVGYGEPTKYSGS